MPNWMWSSRAAARDGRSAWAVGWPFFASCSAGRAALIATMAVLGSKKGLAGMILLPATALFGQCGAR